MKAAACMATGLGNRLLLKVMYIVMNRLISVVV